MKEEQLIQLCNELLFECPHYTTGTLLGRAYYIDRTLYTRYDKAYAFVEKQRQIILQQIN